MKCSGIARVARVLVVAGMCAGVLAIALEAMCVVLYEHIFVGSMYEFDAEAGYRARAFFRWGDGNVTNSLGWNDVEHDVARQPGLARVLLMGDSYSWAGGLKGNYATLLEDELAQLGRASEVLNLGYAGSHLGEQAVWLKRDGIQFSPDLVVLAFYVGNDFSDAIGWRRVFPLGGQLRSVDVREVPLWVGDRPFLADSHILTFLRSMWRRAGRLTRSDLPGIPRDVYLDVERERMRLANPSYFESIAENVQFVTSKLREIRDTLAREGIPFMVVALPDPFQVDEGLREDVARKFGLTQSDFPILDLAQRNLEELCGMLDISFFDLLPFFIARHEGGQQKLYLENEPHWDGAGNELAAEAMAVPLLKELGATSGE